MTNETLFAAAMTAFQLTWSTLWGYLHVSIRKNRRYAEGRTQTRADTLYKRINPLLFVAQITLTIACFWSNATWLLPFHHRFDLRVMGAGLLASALVLTIVSLRHLGSNYSPCYDSHLPATLTTSGPYARIRHPMYLAKLLASAGTLLASGTMWFVPSTIYMFIVTLRAVRREDDDLRARLPGYVGYSATTYRLVPFVY